MTGLGIMSGSSLDGLDIAAVSFARDNFKEWELISSNTFTLPEDLVILFKQIDRLDIPAILKLESVFTKFIAQCIQSFIAAFPVNVDFIAVHGQTLIHLPEEQSSWQMVNGGMLASLCDKTVVTDFRNQDMALGGQGAPMAVIADRDLFEGYDYYLNLGGIANISYLENDIWHAFDLIPFNQVSNYFAGKSGLDYDRDGLLAREGIINNKMLDFCNAHPYLTIKAPKSLDNTQVKNDWIYPLDQMEIESRDILRSYIEFASDEIARTIRSNTCLLVTGGGAHHRYFTELLSGKLAKKKSMLTVPENVIADYKESILMAYAGLLRLENIPNFISEATGAKTDTIGGAVYLPPLKSGI
ncbi:MAG: anhydro-N-acetylmuramic acid kinase [Bacteroidia bacterium]|nr:anhydro-N-acetylmuramic acid kinase [Bacteroidia bacterium]